MAPTPVPGTSKAPRILACVLCQNRKIKCDRNSPCSNCVKANVTCTPSTPAPPRKRRRPNQDLQQRLARCEELLSKYTTNTNSPTVASETQSRDEPWTPSGKLVIDNDGTKFTDSHIWAAVHGEISAMRDIIECDETTAAEDCSTPTNPHTPELSIDLLISEGCDGRPEDFLPSPGHAFFLWQTFLERVNPLTKIIHVPSVQPKLVEATTNPGSVPKNVSALLLSIYTLAVAALNERECQQQLGCAKEDVYQRFLSGTRISLMQIGVLRTYDIVVLQTMVLHLFSLAGRVDRHAVWILNGVTIRVAQKMGLHRDGELLGLPPFETEMRRRIWWQIVVLDAVYAIMSGLGQSLLPRFWNTQRPCNIHDADLYPTMTTLQPRDGPTDMIYCLICYDVAAMMADSPYIDTFILGNQTGITDVVPPHEVEKSHKRIQELDQSISKLLDKYCDPSMGPIHELAAGMRQMLTSKCWELTRPMKDQPEWGTEIRNPRDNLFKIAIITLETDVEFYRKARTAGPFLWFLLTHFQIELLIYTAGQLTERTSGNLVDRAWAVIEEQFNFHEELGTLASKTQIALALFVVRGWKVRRAYLQETTGSVPVTPRYVAKLQGLVSGTRHARGASAGSAGTEASGGSGSKPPSAPHGMGLPWDQMLGFADMGNMGWDMFGGTPGTGGVPNYGMPFSGQPGGSWTG